MTDSEIVLRKLGVMREHVARARRRRPADAEALRADVDLQDALCLSVLVALQEAVDVAFHLVVDEGWGVPASNAESFELLARHGVIDLPLAQALEGAVRLRNRIAHAYATLDVPRLHAELPAGLDAVDRYAAAVARFVPPVG